MRRLLFAGAAAAGLISAAPSWAQDQAPAPDVADASAITEVDAVLVATRGATSAERVGSQVAVITRPEIEQRQAVLIAELVAETPGVTYTRSGGPGTVTNVSIRGAEGHHTVVLIDGVKLNDPSSTQGAFDFGNLLVGDIERIEVLRGAQSVLWGSQAIGGVVNIVTAEPREGLEADASLEGGERGTQYVRIGLGGGSARGAFRIAGSVYRTDGFSAYAGGTEPDGYRNEGLAGRGRLNLTDTFSLDLRGVYSSGRNDIDGFLQDSPEHGRTDELVGYAGLNLTLLEGRLKNRLAYAYTNTDRAYFDPRFPGRGTTFLAEGENRRLEYQGAYAIRDGWLATFGAEREESEFSSESPSPAFPTPRIGGRTSIDSIYGQLQAEAMPGLTLTGGLRHDDHGVFGEQTLAQAQAAWSLNEGATVLRASFGEGFRAPGLYELFSEYGNVTLDPEDVDSWDASIAQRLFDGRLVVSATWFARRARNEINFFSCGAEPDPLCTVNGAPRFGYYANIASSEAQGVELAAEARPFEALTVTANFTYTDTEIGSGPNRGNRLVRRPRQTANLIATYTWPNRLSTGLTLRHVGEVFENAANTRRLDGYTVVDVRAAWPVKEEVEVFGRIENLFDEAYQTVADFGAPGRGAFVGLRVRY